MQWVNSKLNVYFVFIYYIEFWYAILVLYFTVLKCIGSCCKQRIYLQLESG